MKRKDHFLAIHTYENNFSAKLSFQRTFQSKQYQCDVCDKNLKLKEIVIHYLQHVQL